MAKFEVLSNTNRTFHFASSSFGEIKIMIPHYKDLRFSPGTHDWENTESTVTFDNVVKQIRPHYLPYKTKGTASFDDIYQW